MDLRKQPIGQVSLEKGTRATIPLEKQDSKLTVEASLVWDGGSTVRRARGADLDLYALYVPAAEAVRSPDLQPGYVFEHLPSGLFRRGDKEARKAQSAALATRVDAGKAVYWNNLGSLKQAPFIRLSGDSKRPGRETVRIKRADQQGYALICAYSALGNGVGSFRSYGAHAEVTDGRGSTVTVPLYEDNNYAYWVVIAFVDFTSPDGVAIQHVEQYSKRHSERRPVLHTDGTIILDKGPAEFKRR